MAYFSRLFDDCRSFNPDEKDIH